MQVVTLLPVVRDRHPSVVGYHVVADGLNRFRVSLHPANLKDDEKTTTYDALEQDSLSLILAIRSQQSTKAKTYSSKHIKVNVLKWFCLTERNSLSCE